MTVELRKDPKSYPAENLPQGMFLGRIGTYAGLFIKIDNSVNVPLIVLVQPKQGPVEFDSWYVYPDSTLTIYDYESVDFSFKTC
jgi:hypothetical protein